MRARSPSGQEGFGFHPGLLGKRGIHTPFSLGPALCVSCEKLEKLGEGQLTSVQGGAQGMAAPGQVWDGSPWAELRREREGCSGRSQSLTGPHGKGQEALLRLLNPGEDAGRE